MTDILHRGQYQKYKLRDPLDPEANLGPVVDVASANRVRADIQDALSKGAQGLIDASAFPLAKVVTLIVLCHTSNFLYSR